MTEHSEDLLKMRILGAPMDHQSAAERQVLIECINRVAQEERRRREGIQRVWWLSSAAIALLLFGGLVLLGNEGLLDQEPPPPVVTELGGLPKREGSTPEAKPSSLTDDKTRLVSGTQIRAAT
jgi:hypothetical protein